MAGTAVLFALLLFLAGLAVGSHRRFARAEDKRWGFHGPGFNVRLPHGFIEDGRGVVGTIQSAATSSLTVLARDGSVQTVLIRAETTVRDRSGAASSTALVSGETVTVLGVRNADGTISADLIRIGGRPQPAH